MNKQHKEEKYILDPFDIGRRLEYAERSVLNSAIHKENKQLILEYKDYVLLNKKLTKERAIKWLCTLLPLAKMLNRPFTEATLKDFKELDRKIMESDYSDSTKYDFERMLRKFYKWIKSDDKNTELEEYPPEVKWIKPKKPTREPLSSDEVISWTDVQEMSLYCQNHRDRAFIKSLWESSNRIREHLMLRIGDVKEEEYGLTFDVKTTKAGNKTFQKFLTLSEPDLKEWLQFHPKPDPAAPLWIRIDGRKPNTGIDYDYARKLLRVLG